MKKILFTGLIAFILLSCSKDNSTGDIAVSFILENKLLWNIGYTYHIEGTSSNGESFTGSKVYIQYVDQLLENQTIKRSTTLTLYKDENPIWTSDPLTKNCSIIYQDNPSPIEDAVIMN